MPAVLTADTLAARPRGDGWAEVPVHEEPRGEFAAVRWELDPGAAAGPLEHARGEGMLYVVSGAGELHVGEERLALAEETVVWLEAGDRYTIEAGPRGLAVLAARAEKGDCP